MVSTFEKIRNSARKKNIPVMKEDGMNFIVSFLEQHTEVRDILEVGTAVGLSAMMMASIRWDMTVDTLEIDPAMYDQAAKNIQENGFANRIHVFLTDGADFLSDKVYDMILIDAAKSQYRRYLEHFLRNARKGTIFVFDNLNFHGIVDNNALSHNRSTIQMVHKIKIFREHLLNDSRFETQFYKDIGDGIAISVYRGEENTLTEQ